MQRTRSIGEIGSGDAEAVAAPPAAVPIMRPPFARRQIPRGSRADDLFPESSGAACTVWDENGFIVDLVARAHGTPRMAPSGFT
jgi:hypothetical protein